MDDLKLIHIPGKDLLAPDALSQQPNLIPKIDNDNKGVTLLPQSLFVSLIDAELSNKITKSSEKDPLVLNTLQALDGEVSTQFRSQLSDWTYEARILSYQGPVYVPDKDNLWKQLVQRFHDHKTAGHPGDEPGSPLYSYATHFHFSNIAYQAWLHHYNCHMMQPTTWTMWPSVTATYACLCSHVAL